MINSLINMAVPAEINNIELLDSNGKYSIYEYASSFIKGMGETQLKRFKQMLENGIQCGMSVAESYGVDYSDFINEVKNQLKINGRNE